MTAFADSHSGFEAHGRAEGHRPARDAFGERTHPRSDHRRGRDGDGRAIRATGPSSIPPTTNDEAYTSRAIIIFLISAIAFAGFRLFGQVLAQFMIVWQR